LLATAGFDTSHTQVQERLVAYVIMALILPPANLNRLKLSILQGRGAHQQVANLRMQRHGLILVGTFLLCRAGAAPSYLLIAVLVADSYTAVNLRRYLILPSIRDLLRQMRRIFVTLRQSRAYLFADNSLDMLLNIDLFVLGLFVTAWDLGIYAEAAVLVRFFLIVPAGIKPILRRQYIQATGPGSTQTPDHLVRRHASILFSLHAVLALVVILNFPVVLDLIFETHGETRHALNLFQIFLPGLIFFGPWTALEPVYEALNRVQRLKRLTLLVSVVNLILTFYLVPAAGVVGGATATMLAMLIYFLLFGRHLGMRHQTDKFTFLAAGMGLYLIHNVFSWLSWTGAVTIWMGPLLAVLLFYACGVFQPVSISIERRHPL
jgi:O-antigen/teichoic acid export membrane protein